MNALIDETKTEERAHEIFCICFNMAKMNGRIKNTELRNFQTELLLAEIEETQKLVNESQNNILQ